MYTLPVVGFGSSGSHGLPVGSSMSLLKYRFTHEHVDGCVMAVKCSAQASQCDSRKHASSKLASVVALWLTPVESRSACIRRSGASSTRFTRSRVIRRSSRAALARCACGAPPPAPSPALAPAAVCATRSQGIVHRMSTGARPDAMYRRAMTPRDSSSEPCVASSAHTAVLKLIMTSVPNRMSHTRSVMNQKPVALSESSSKNATCVTTVHDVRAREK